MHEVNEITNPIKVEYVLTNSDGVIFYRGTRVSNSNGTFALSPGYFNFDGKNTYYNRQELLEIWVQAYEASRKPFDPEDCAHIFRTVKNICHTCCGDGVIQTHKDGPLVICSSCAGTAYGE